MYIFLNFTTRQMWQTVTSVTTINHFYVYASCVVYCHINSAWPHNLVWPMRHQRVLITWYKQRLDNCLPIRPCPLNVLRALNHYVYTSSNSFIASTWKKKRCPVSSQIFQPSQWGSKHERRRHLGHSTFIRHHL